jgi:hypothetical protein
VGAGHRGLESHVGVPCGILQHRWQDVGTVGFADGSVVNIEGVRIGLYECKTGERKALTNVYFIPRLTTSIFSVGHLDEYGYEVQIKSCVMTLRDESHRLLARV